MKIHPPKESFEFTNIDIPSKEKIMDSFSQQIKDKVGDIISHWMSMVKWESITFTIPTKPEPAARPRLSGYRVYVPRAAKNARFFDQYVRPTLDGLYIHSPCRFKTDIFVETPQSFTKTQKLLAELRIMRPWGGSGDIDNYEKSVYDQIQPNSKRGHVGILSDDSMIIEAHTKKYYSMNPHYAIEIRYMTNIPDELRKVMKLDGPQFVKWDDIL